MNRANDGPPRPRYRVPDELRETLLDFTIAYLLERPPSVVEFGMAFFSRLRGDRGGPTQAGGPASNQTGQDANSNMQALSVEPFDLSGPVSREGMGEVDATAPSNMVHADGRRKSVFAEAYNPEEDGDDEKIVIHPKSDEQRAQLTEAVKNILLFRSLDSEQMQDVINAMFEKKVAAGEDVIKQGDDGDNFYVIVSGKYKVFVQVEGEPEPKTVANYDEAGSFGELALMYNMPRAATVQAETDGSLFAMDRLTFRKIVLKNAYKKRQIYEALIDSVPMLKTLENYERMNLADALVPKTFKDGESIINQGDEADGMYFIEDGEVNIMVVDKDGEDKEEKLINSVAKGGYFGELALLTKNPRAATVKAVGDVKVAFLDVLAFERLLGPCMEIMKRNADDYEQQLVKVFGSKSIIPADIRT